MTTFKSNRFLLAAGLLLLLYCLALPGQEAAAANREDKTVAPLERILSGLKETAAQTRTLAADMEQEKHLAIFSRVLHSSGRFYFRRPDCWRWELRKPAVSGLSVCNGIGKSWNRGDSQPVQFKTSQKPWLSHFTTQITAWTTADLDFLKKQYALKLLRENPPLIRLTPRNERARQMIKALEIGLAPDLSHVQTITIRENDDDFTVIKFSHVVINQPLPDDLF